jgi:hypothetical protein
MDAEKESSMKNTLKHFVAFTLFAILSSCATAPTARQYGPIDLSEKTITIPPGGDRLIGLLKERLYREGWDVSVLARESVITDKTSLQEISYDKYNTRFLLLLDYDFGFVWIPGDSIARFDFSLIDLKAKKEVFTYSGGYPSILSAYSFAKVVNGFFDKLNSYTSQ